MVFITLSSLVGLRMSSFVGTHSACLAAGTGCRPCIWREFGTSFVKAWPFEVFHLTRLGYVL